MRKIDKGREPESLRLFKRNNPNLYYKDLTEVERIDIRNACTREQFYLCAYCCQTISGQSTDTMNEHVEPQSLANTRTVDFSNIVASCRNQNQCDAAHKNELLTLTPFMPECETELRFKFSGRVEGLTDRAKKTIKVLNLGDDESNNKALIEKRKQIIDGLIWQEYGDPQHLQLEDDQDVLEILLDTLNEPKDGRLESFSPVLHGILREFLSGFYGR
ncbi:TIGR02646 family protein [Paraburkholderia caribensis]|nr:TIGR02646 family protein [Paraburkholderia caribensis]